MKKTVSSKSKERRLAMSDISGSIEDVSYAEKVVFNRDFLKKLASLKQIKKKASSRKKLGIVDKEYVYIGREDIMKCRYDEPITMSSAARKVNQVFAAMKIPFRAGTCSSNKAVNGADTLKIFRTGKSFDNKKYTYDEPTIGMIARAEHWIDENYESMSNILKKIGIDILVFP